MLVDGETSRAALDAMLSSLERSSLDLTPEQIALLSPQGEAQGGQQFTREIFKGKTGPAFDHMTAVAAASDLVFRMILDAERMNRMEQFSAANNDILGASEALALVTNRLLPGRSRGLDLVHQTVVGRYVAGLVGLHGSMDASTGVRGLARRELTRVRSNLSSRTAFGAELGETIRIYLETGVTDGIKPLASTPSVPPGSPIGSGDQCWHCDTFDLVD